MSVSIVTSRLLVWHAVKEELGSVVDREVALDEPVAPPVLNCRVGVQRGHDRLHNKCVWKWGKKNKLP